MSRPARIIQRLHEAGISFTRESNGYVEDEWYLSVGDDVLVLVTGEAEAFLDGYELGVRQTLTDILSD